MEPSYDSQPCKKEMPERIHIVSDVPTRIEYEDRTFEVSFADNAVVVRDQGGDGRVAIRQKNQQVPYKATILGGLVLTEERSGDIVFASSFFIDWEEEFSVPELCFKEPPRRITRSYRKGQRIELGLERVTNYCVTYQDGVFAKFIKREERGFEFTFSTGFYGTFWYDDDGSYTLKFKGDRLDPEEDDLHSQSKFVVSRSKYTGMLLLILQDDATVQLA